jgi:hypothetical protein
VPAALPLIGAAVGAASQINQGQIAKAQAKNNAILAGYESDQVGKNSVADQNRMRQQVRQMLGRQRAVIGANGIQDLGSPLAVQEDTAAMGEEDIANIRNQAALEQYGLKIGAKDALYRGDQAATAANANAFGTLASAYSSKGISSFGSSLKAGYGKLKSFGNTGRAGQDTPILSGDGYYG